MDLNALADKAYALQQSTGMKMSAAVRETIQGLGLPYEKVHRVTTAANRAKLSADRRKASEEVGVPSRWDTAKPEDVIRNTDRGASGGAATTEDLIEEFAASPAANAEELDGTDDIVRDGVSSGTASTNVATLAEVQAMLDAGTSGWTENKQEDPQTKEASMEKEASHRLDRLRGLTGIAPTPIQVQEKTAGVDVTDIHVGLVAAVNKNSGAVLAASLSLAGERAALATEVAAAEKTSGYSLGELLMLTKLAMDESCPELSKDAFLDSFPAIADEVDLDLEAAGYNSRRGDGELNHRKIAATRDRLFIRDALANSEVEMGSSLAKSAMATVEAYKELAVRRRAEEILREKAQQAGAVTVN